MANFFQKTLFETDLQVGGYTSLKIQGLPANNWPVWIMVRPEEINEQSPPYIALFRKPH